MSTRVVMVALLFACGAKPPERVATPPPQNVAKPVVRAPAPATKVDDVAPPVRGVRPKIDLAYLVPDPTGELRWPLTASNHPELEPQFEIARALAEPGVSWIDLCRLGAQNRNAGKDKRDHIAYLRGWCSVGKHDADAALAQLAPLAHSVVPGLAPAVRNDFANILVEHGTADDAARLLAKHKITDIVVLDVLAATYVELGKLDDAYTINELALARDNRRDQADRCQRLTRRIVLQPPPPRLKPDLRTDTLFDVPMGAHPTCTRLDRALACWLSPAADCTPYFIEQNIDPAKAHLLIRAYNGWPATATGLWEPTWRHAVSALPLAGADHLAVAALTYDLQTTLCNAYHQQKIVRVATEAIRADPAHDPALDPQLVALIDKPETLCFKADDGSAPRDY